ncbi:MFS transporter [Desulfofundulus sp. TPOSR]|uniref:MFS transporter n=1 Tax=Desulfofundulus sp. TPOSR TaxID=2714340 RepID=UPI00140E5F88|nr:MFS transporter [Desulfofundulus sp. TPOSR]NHM25765.1 MFS transporter [Desulfofundulus sp. TPOSR]
MKQGSQIRWVVLAVIWITFIINYLDRVSVLTFLPLIRQDLNLTHSQIGQAASAFFLAYALTQVFLGWAADRFRPKVLMNLAIGLFSIVTFFTGLMRSFAQFMVIRVLLGIGEGLHTPPIFRTIANWFPKSEKGRATAIFATTWGIGPAFIPLLVTWLATMFESWRPVFMILFLPGLIGILLVTYLIDDTPDAAKQRKRITEEEYRYIKNGLVEVGVEQRLNFREQVRVVLGDISFWAYCVSLFCLLGVFWGSTAWLSSFLYEQHKFKIITMGALASLPYVAAATAMVAGGWCLDRIFKGRVKPLLILSFISSIPVLYFIARIPTGHVGLLVLCLILLGFCVNLSFGVVYGYPQIRYPKETLGFASGFSNGSGQFGSFVAPLVAGYLVVKTATGVDYSNVFTFFALLALGGAVCALLMSEKPYHYEAKLSTYRQVSPVEDAKSSL